MAGRRSTCVFFFAFLVACVPLASGATSSATASIQLQCPDEISACVQDSECVTCSVLVSNPPDSCSSVSTSITDFCESAGAGACCAFEGNEDCLSNDLLLDVIDCALGISDCSSNDMACLAEFASSTTNSVAPDDDTATTSMDDIDTDTESSNGAHGLASTSAFFVCTSAAVAGVLASVVGLVA